jgi:hypothetical protein
LGSGKLGLFLRFLKYHAAPPLEKCKNGRYLKSMAGQVSVETYYHSSSRHFDDLIINGSNNGDSAANHHRFDTDFAEGVEKLIRKNK